MDYFILKNKNVFDAKYANFDSMVFVILGGFLYHILFVASDMTHQYSLCKLRIRFENIIDKIRKL